MQYKPVHIDILLHVYMLQEIVSQAIRNKFKELNRRPRTANEKEQMLDVRKSTHLYNAIRASCT